MPATHAAFCAVPGCPSRVTRAQRCATHAVDREQARVNWAWRRWYRTPRWKALRQRILLDQGYACAACHLVLPRLEIDHLRKHHGELTAFWDRANLQALCKQCHAAKTQRGE